MTSIDLLWHPPLQDAEDARRRARRRQPRLIFDFVDGATGQEIAARENCAALQAVKLQSRVLINVEDLSLETDFLGQSFGRPFGIAPMGMCDLSWPGADAAFSKQAVQRDLPHCVSTASSTPLETCFERTAGRAWFQLYAGTDAAQTDEMIDRAERAGYQNLIFTVDTPRLSRRNRDLKNGFQVPFRLGPKQIIDFALHPRWSISTLMVGPPKPMNYQTSKLGKSFQRGDSRGGVDWRFLEQLRKRWNGNLIVKGVMSGADARRIKSAGADAIYVSNHGGRQLDSAPAAITALPKIRKVVGRSYPLIFDSGLRSGDDIVRALALGADFVMLGRPLLYALGAGGPRGLSSFLDYLEEDVKAVMAQIGVTKISQINAKALIETHSGNEHSGNEND
ncbi:MAG: alpha-hydroxy-acid oxidizing protein [Rhizobiaceae bacterium]|nr:alpha-hydroxy-acid oxidizing protein [Hyphomicrobiales bacterium]NRB29897.1 alpha-hydroxy-acid oxidizing protein [Rhizobiaceae bacterium]